MMARSQILLGGAVALVVGFSTLWGDNVAADDAKDVRDTVQKLANAIEKGDAGTVKTLTEELKSGDLEEVMNLMQRRNPAAKKKTFGVGKTPGSVTPDGIEAKIQNLSKAPKPQAQIAKESSDVAEMGYRVAAIAEVALAKVPEKDEGSKKRSDWLEWAGGMRKAAQELAEAAKEKNPSAVKAAAAKLNSACNNCHGTFRD
jgi:hypothetical protein